MHRHALLMVCAAWSLGCAGGHGVHGSEGDSVGSTADAGDDGDTDTDTGAPAGLGDVDALAPVALRRLSRAELQAALLDLTALPAADIATMLAVLPGDGATPYDNDATLQQPSGPLVEGMFAIAEAVAAAVVEDPARRDALMGCSPVGPDDAACLRSFAAGFGRRALRRPLDEDELDALAAFASFGAEADDFDVAARMVVTALLLDARFLYRVEIGTPVADRDDLVGLDGYEIATRLALTLWGTVPDDALLDRAGEGALDQVDTAAEVALAMLQDRRALAQLQRMHALWLGYENLSMAPALARSLRAETDAVLERALSQGQWSTIFTATQTWLDETTAAHYDIPLPGGQPGWVDYPDIRRRGVLSHGTLLSLGAKFGDTSPTERGKAVWTRLLCHEIPPPPPQIDTGLPPTGGPADACKLERYDMRDKSECAACHGVIDTIGFGLENYGPEGQWRTSEPGRPECAIDGHGSLTGVGDFAGAGALGELLLDSGELEGCYVRNMVQFAVGRVPEPDDEALLLALTDRFETTDDAAGVLLAFVTSDAFRHRRLP